MVPRIEYVEVVLASRHTLWASDRLSRLVFPVSQLWSNAIRSQQQFSLGTVLDIPKRRGMVG